MNNHAKRLCTHLEALDFRRDYDAEDKTTARRVYRHANDPEQAIKVFDHMSDNTITSQRKLADKIVGLGTSGPDAPTIKERARIHRRQQQTQRQRDDEARRLRGDAAVALMDTRESGGATEATSTEREMNRWTDERELREAGFMLSAHGFSQQQQGTAMRLFMAQGVMSPVRHIRGMSPDQITRLLDRIA